MSRRRAATWGAPTQSSRSSTRNGSAEGRSGQKMKAFPLAWNRLRLDFLHKPCHLAKGAAAREEGSRAARTCYGWTVVLAVAVLFAVFGSVGEVKVAVAVFVIVPLLVGFSTRVTVTDAPLAIVPTLQTTAVFDGLSVQDPRVVPVDP